MTPTWQFRSMESKTKIYNIYTVRCNMVVVLWLAAKFPKFPLFLQIKVDTENINEEILNYIKEHFHAIQ